MDSKERYDENLKKAEKLADVGQKVPNGLLVLRNRNGCIASELAIFHPIWVTNDKNILKEKDCDGNTVAHLLATYRKHWTTNDKDILSLTNKIDQTVESMLEYRKNVK